MPPRGRPTRARKAAATPADTEPEVAPAKEQEELKFESLSDTVAPEAAPAETPAELPAPEPEVEAPAEAPAPPPLFAPTAADFDNSDDEPLPDSPPLDKPKPAWQNALPAPIAPMMRGRSVSKSPKKSSKRTPGTSQSPTKKRSTKPGSKSSSETPAPGIAPVANMAPPPLPRSRVDLPAEDSDNSESDHNAYSGYDTDDDPVIRSYDVYTTSELADSLYVFQYPVRSSEKPYRSATQSCPLEARLKPKSKVVEIDVPMNVHLNYDEQKGRTWGEVLRKAKQASEGGIAGKVSAGARGGKRRKIKEDDEEEEEPDINYMDFNDAVKKGRILNKQTLGSKMHPDQPKYMLGVFKGGTLKHILMEASDAN